MTLVGVSLLRQPQDFTAAQHQLKDIQSAVDNWEKEEMTVAFQKTLDDVHALETPLAGACGIGDAMSGVSVGASELVLSSARLLLLPQTASTAQKTVSQSDWRSIFQRPATLAEFKEFWIETSSRSRGDEVIPSQTRDGGLR